MEHNYFSVGGGSAPKDLVRRPTTGSDVLATSQQHNQLKWGLFIKHLTV